MKANTKKLVLLGVLTAIELIMVMTPIGSVPIGQLKITLGMIPVAVAAISLGTTGGTILGAVWGIASFLGCLGIGTGSGLLIALFAVNPALTFVLCFVPRTLDGLLLGLICKGSSKIMPQYPAYAVTGLCSALINTVLFLSMLMLFFSNTEKVQGLMEKFGTTNVFAFMVALAGLNAVLEMVAATVLTAGVGIALYRSRLIGTAGNSPKAA